MVSGDPFGRQGHYLSTRDNKFLSPIIPQAYFRALPNAQVNIFKVLVNTEDVWEVRVQLGNDIFRLLGFFDESENNLLILTHGFCKEDSKDSTAGN